MNRRKFLVLAGGGIVLAAGGGAGGFAVTRTPDKALQPWKDAGSLYKEPRKKALSYAILAPNPHNRQPWLIDLRRAGQVILTVDTDRLLPHTDPFNRQIVIGLGCFLETLRMAASHDGFRADIELFPEGADDKTLDTRPAAVASFTQDDAVVADPLFAQVMARRSLKEPYDEARPVSPESLAILEATAVNGTATGSNREAGMLKILRKLSHQAFRLEYETPRTLKESVDLFRIGKAEIEANPDGIDLSGPLFEALHMAGILTREATLDPASTAHAQGLDSILAAMDTAMAHVWLITRTNTRADQINAGRDWVRINLAATAQGLGTQPLSQALQEYPEMKPCYDKIHALLAPDGGTVQMFARLGYAAPVAPSPRWPLNAKILGDTA